MLQTSVGMFMIYIQTKFHMVNSNN